MFLGATTAILPLGTNTCTKSKLMWYGMHVSWLALAPWPLVSCHRTCLVGQLLTCVWNCWLTHRVLTCVACSWLPSSCNFRFQWCQQLLVSTQSETRIQIDPSAIWLDGMQGSHSGNQMLLVNEVWEWGLGMRLTIHLVNDIHAHPQTTP